MKEIWGKGKDQSQNGVENQASVKTILFFRCLIFWVKLMKICLCYAVSCHSELRQVIPKHQEIRCKAMNFLLRGQTRSINKINVVLVHKMLHNHVT